MFAGKGTSSNPEAFNSETMRIQGLHVPVRVKARLTGVRELWMTRDIEALVQKVRHGTDTGSNT